MANLPNLDGLREWLRIDTTDFDGQLSALVETGKAIAKEEANRDFDDASLFPDGWPAPVVTFVYATAASWYNNPQSISEKTFNVNPHLSGLLDPYRSFTYALPT